MTPQADDTSPSKGTGFIYTARNFLWRNKAPAANFWLRQGEGSTSQNQDAGQSQDDEHEHAQDNGVEDPAQDEDDTFHTVEQPSLPLAIEIQVPVGKGKRKRTEVQPDLPIADTHPGHDEEPSAKRRAGRPKGSIKKTPDGKELRGRIVPTQNEAPSSSNKPQSSSNVKTRRVTKMLPKATTEDTTQMCSSTSKVANDKEVRGDGIGPVEKNRRLWKAPQTQEVPENTIEPAVTLQEHELLTAENQDGNTGLYDSQSPLKKEPIRSKTERSVSLNPEKRPATSSSQEENCTMDGESSEGEEDNGEDEEGPPELDPNPLIDFHDLEKMLTIADRVGHFHLKEGGEGRLILQEVDRAYQTTDGKRVAKTLKKLTAAYDNLHNVQISKGYSEAAESAVTECIDAMLDKVHYLIDTRIAVATSKDYDKPVRTKNVLRDTYFIVVPQYMELLVLSARIRPLQTSMTTENLEQFKSLILTFSVLVNGACKIPTSHQPQVKDLSGNYRPKTTFKISQPTRALKPMILVVEKKLQQELFRRSKAAGDARHKERRLAEVKERKEREEREQAGDARREERRLAEAKKQEEIDRAADARREERRLAEAKKREEREQARLLEHRRKIREADRRIKEAIASHPLYNHPLFGPALREKDEEDKEGARLRQSNQPFYQSRPNSISNGQQDYSGNEEYDNQADQDHAQDEEGVQDENMSFLDQDPLEVSDTEDRVRGVFGSNNSNHISISWTSKQYTAFIATMQQDASKQSLLFSSIPHQADIT